MIKIIKCPTCWGQGKICVGLNDDLTPVLEDCPNCGGHCWITVEEPIPLIADLKKAVDCLIIACEDNHRSIDSMYETLAIQGVNIRLLIKGFKEISESEDGRDNYLSSTLKEIMAKKKTRDVYTIT